MIETSAAETPFLGTISDLVRWEEAVCSIPNSPPEVKRNAEHDEMGAIGGGQVVSGEAELGEVVFVFNERSYFGSYVVAGAGQDIEARGKGRFRAEGSV